MTGRKVNQKAASSQIIRSKSVGKEMFHAAHWIPPKIAQQNAKVIV